MGERPVSPNWTPEREKIMEEMALKTKIKLLLQIETLTGEATPDDVRKIDEICSRMITYAKTLE